jgi:hypothetical protein
MAEWSNGGNGYIRTIYGTHTHTDDINDDDDDDDEDDDTLIFYSIDSIVRTKYLRYDIHIIMMSLTMHERDDTGREGLC